MRTAETKVYTYDELTETAKDTAVSVLSDVNVDNVWYDRDGYAALETLKNAGIGADWRGVSFDLERGAYLYYSPFRHERDGIKSMHAGLWVEDQIKLAKTLEDAKVVPHALVEAVERGDVSFGIETNHYGGGAGANSLSVNADGDAYDLWDSLDHDAITDWLRGILEDLRIELRKDYEYLTSREAIEETIRANDYEFTEDGQLW